MASPAERAVAGHPGWAGQPDPGGVPRVAVADIVRSLQFYLDELDCAVREVADGWALLRSGPFALVLMHEPTPTWPARLQASPEPRTAQVRPHRRPGGAAASIPPPLIWLFTPDVHALRCRLGTDVLPAGLAPAPLHDSVDEIEMYDPDQHRVVITQVGSWSPPQRMSTPGQEDLGHRPPADDFLLRDAVQRYLRDAALGSSQT